MFNTYNLGDSPNLAAGFISNTQFTDPTDVWLSVRKPDGTITTYHYGVDGIVTRSVQGKFNAAITLDQSGFWFYRWWGTGAVIAARERRLHVRAAQTVPQG